MAGTTADEARTRKSRFAAWLLWLLFGCIGADRFYLRRRLAGALQALLAAAAAVFFLSRPTQALLARFGASVAGFGGSPAGPDGLWQTEAMLCCLAALVVWKLTDAANLNRAVRNLNRAAGEALEGRGRLAKGCAVLLTGIALALGLGADALAAGFSAYAAATAGSGDMAADRPLAMLRALVCLAALFAALRAASRAQAPLSRWLLGVPGVLMLGFSGALYCLLARYLGLGAFAFLGRGPFSAEWLRAMAWHSDASLILLMRGADGNARLGLMMSAAVIQGGLGVAVAAVLTAIAALAPSGRARSAREM